MFCNVCSVGESYVVDGAVTPVDTGTPHRMEEERADVVEGIMASQVHMAEVKQMAEVCFSDLQRKQFRELLDEWGQSHIHMISETFRDVMASTGSIYPSQSASQAPMFSSLQPTLQKAHTLDSLTSRFAILPRISDAGESALTQGESCGSSNANLQTINSDLPWQKRSVVESVVGDGANLHQTYSEKTERPAGCSCQQFIRWLVRSHRFGLFSAAAIIANSIIIGFQTHLQMRHLLYTGTPVYETAAMYIEVVFTLWFGIEVLLRGFAEGLRPFFQGKEHCWNIFDLSLALQGAMEVVLNFSGHLSHLRMLRLLRMIKLLRVIRLVRGMSELRFILCSIMGSVKSTFWASFMLLMITYMFGVIFVQVVVGYVHEEDISPEEEALLRRYWCSIPMSMLSLLMCSTGGFDWGLFAESFLNVGWPYCFLFLFYLICFLFVVMPTITGLFVEATINQSRHDKMLRIQTELDKKGQYIKHLRQLFFQFDADKNGFVCLEEFTEALEDPDMQAFLNSLMIDASDAECFFRMLSEHTSDKKIDVETFVVGCIKLRGEAKAMDMFLTLSYQVTMDQRLDKIDGMVQELVRGLKWQSQSPTAASQVMSSPELFARSAAAKQVMSSSEHMVTTNTTAKQAEKLALEQQQQQKYQQWQHVDVQMEEPFSF